MRYFGGLTIEKKAAALGHDRETPVGKSACSSSCTDAGHRAMNPSEWDRIESLFGEALDLPPAARAPYLDRNCSSIGSLREAVDRLLFEHEQTSGVLDRPLFAPAIRPEQDPWA